MESPFFLYFGARMRPFLTLFIFLVFSVKLKAGEITNNCFLISQFFRTGSMFTANWSRLNNKIEINRVLQVLVNFFSADTSTIGLEINVCRSVTAAVWEHWIDLIRRTIVRTNVFINYGIKWKCRKSAWWIKIEAIVLIMHKRTGRFGTSSTKKADFVSSSFILVVQRVLKIDSIVFIK